MKTHILDCITIQHFSREWQNLFTDLQKRDYNVTYDNGIIQIQNAENRLNVCLVRSRWLIKLEKPFQTPDRTTTTDCAVAIGRIEHWLYKARANPREYSFRGMLRPTGTVMIS